MIAMDDLTVEMQFKIQDLKLFFEHQISNYLFMLLFITHLLKTSNQEMSLDVPGLREQTLINYDLG